MPRLVRQALLSSPFIALLLAIIYWAAPYATARLIGAFFVCLSGFRLSCWWSEQARNNWLDDHYDWSKEIVVITGGAGGIGRCLSRELEKTGATVALIDVVEPTALQTSSKTHYYQCDLTSPTQLAAVAAQLRAQVGSPTVLINNAGVVKGHSLLEIHPDHLRRTFDVNTLAAFWTVKEFVPDMIAANHGMVVTMSSLTAFFTLPKLVDYSASKAALVSLHEGLGAELTHLYRAPKVRTVLVQPGHVRTALFEGFEQGMGLIMPALQPETVAKAVTKQILTGRSGHVTLPQTGAALTAVRALPSWVISLLTAKGRSSMVDFQGRG